MMIISILLASLMLWICGVYAARHFREREGDDLSWHRYATQSNTGFRELNLFAGIAFYERWQKNRMKRWCAMACVFVGAAGSAYAALTIILRSWF